MVSFEVPPLLTGFGLKLACVRDGNPETLSVTELLAPTAPTLTV